MISHQQQGTIYIMTFGVSFATASSWMQRSTSHLKVHSSLVVLIDWFVMRRSPSCTMTCNHKTSKLHHFTVIFAGSRKNLSNPFLPRHFQSQVKYARWRSREARWVASWCWQGINVLALVESPQSTRSLLHHLHLHRRKDGWQSVSHTLTESQAIKHCAFYAWSWNDSLRNVWRDTPCSGGTSHATFRTDINVKLE